MKLDSSGYLGNTPASDTIDKSFEHYNLTNTASSRAHPLHPDQYIKIINHKKTVGYPACSVTLCLQNCYGIRILETLTTNRYIGQNTKSVYIAYQIEESDTDAGMEHLNKLKNFSKNCNEMFPKSSITLEAKILRFWGLFFNEQAF